MFRQSCGYCHFCNTMRPSDITLADFWHSENVDKEFNADNKGANIVLINTPMGRVIFEAVKDKLSIIPVDISKCMQGNLQRPTSPHPQRQQFEDYYANKGFEKTMKKFGLMGWRHKVVLYQKKFNRILSRFK